MQIYVYVGRPKIETEVPEKKLKSDIQNIFEQSTRAVEKLDQEYENKTLKRLNRNTLTLASFERVYPSEQKYGK